MPNVTDKIPQPTTEPPQVLGKQIRLSGCRQLGYTEYGDPQGKLIFHFHGWVSSRLEFGHNHDIAKTLGARVISVDRPGVGLSDFQPGRRILDWPDDITQLADALGIDRFAVSGWSFGGPYAAVCAYKIPHRLTAAGIIAGIPPLNRPGATQGMMRPGRLFLGLGKKAPWVLRPIAWQIGRMVRSTPPRFVEKMSASLPAADWEVYSRLAIGTGLVDSVAEMFRTGNRGAYWDGVAFLRPWGGSGRGYSDESPPLAGRCGRESAFANGRVLRQHDP